MDVRWSCLRMTVTNSFHIISLLVGTHMLCWDTIILRTPGVSALSSSCVSLVATTGSQRESQRNITQLQTSEVVLFGISSRFNGAKARVTHGGSQGPARTSDCVRTMFSCRTPHSSSFSGVAINTRQNNNPVSQGELEYDPSALPILSRPSPGGFSSLVSIR